jgi:hypothetical protein
MASVLDDWGSPSKASKAQRKALYRLGLSKSLTRRLDAVQADTYIKALLDAAQAAGKPCSKPKFDPLIDSILLA